MKILHRYMLKQFFFPFIAAFFIAMIVLLMQFLWRYIDDLVGKGLELSIIAELLLYTCGQVAVMAFPLAVLLASIFTLGNLGENYELIALKAAGISLQRIVFPLIILSFFIAIGAFMCANYVIPVANLEWRRLIYDIQQQRPELQIQEGIFYNGIDGYSIRIGKRDLKTHMLYNLRINDHRERRGNTNVILADSGRMKMTSDKRFLELELYSGHSYNDMVEERKARQNRTYPFRQDIFEYQVLRIELPGYELERSDAEIFRSGHNMMNLEQLTYMIDSLSTVIKSQENQLRSIMQPNYRPPDYQIPIDTSLRSKVPNNFMSHFNKQPKANKQRAIQDAVNSARNQKEQVSGLIYEMNIQNRQTWRYQIAWHQKLTMPFACFIFFFIGAPLGAIIRKGGLGTPIIIAVLFFVFYYVISMTGERSAREGAMTPFEGIWMSTFIIFTIGVFLTWMATRDSSIFNQELYLNYIKKGLSFIFVTHIKARPAYVYQATESDLIPENMILKIEELSNLCKKYLDGDFHKRLRLSKIWYELEDRELAEIGQKHDLMLAILKQSDMDLISETVAEYPVASLHNCKIKKDSKWHVLAAVVVFPVWLYLYLKAAIQKHTLRNELTNIISANRNLINELIVNTNQETITVDE